MNPRLFLSLFLFAPSVALAEWLDTREGCKAELPNVVSIAQSAGRKSSWLGACSDGFASGVGALRVNVGNRFKSVFSGEMKSGRFDGLVRFHFENVNSEIKEMRFKSISTTDSERYYHEGVVVSEDEYKERSTYIERYQNARVARELELFLISTARFDPNKLADEVREKLYSLKTKEFNISRAEIENEEKSLLIVNDFESIFDIEENDRKVKRERVGLPIFLIASSGESQVPSAMFKIIKKNNSPWRPKYGNYRVTVQFSLEGTIETSMNLLFLSSQKTKEFREKSGPIEFVVSSSNNWSDIKEVKFNEIISSFVFSVFGQENLKLGVTDLKCSYKIIKVIPL